MTEYQLLDMTGKSIGVVELYNDDLPHLIMNDVKITLAGSFEPSERKFYSFVIVPELKLEKKKS